MTRILASLAALALLSGSAMAASTISGTVRSYDSQARTIVLEDGSTVSVPLHVGVPANLGAGSYAKVQFDGETGDATTVFSGSLAGN
ncbi:hypothetical protein [Aquamicrobium terrae]|uniref:Ferric-dicitrate binding protein FerR (Iron transport regulator) n=1 Tax=Aquamicrobium terrae TaxID=1324945 RepID=A0ABV2MZB3_9HYPH